MKKALLLLSLLPLTLAASADQQKDTVSKHYQIEEVVVRSSTKETNDLRKMPNATTVISPLKISNRGIESIKDISGLVPNLYIPDYGSKMTTPFYLRGVGTRSSSQAVGIYVNDIPYMDKSTFDFELMDIQRIEVLRGPQGTLYGRNAMGGIINIYTLSPFDYQGTKVSLGLANYNTYSVKASNYSLLSKKVGLSVSGYYDKSDGFYTNELLNKKVDNEESAGGRLKLDWKITDKLLMNFETAIDYTDQGAFPYGKYDKATGKIAPVRYDYEGYYRRAIVNNKLRFEYKTDKVLFSSNTGHQYLDDDMMMDQDFSERSIFTINQRQKQNSFNQEFAAKSNTDNNYQWSVGLFGFYNDMRTTGDVTFYEDGVKGFLQPIFDKIPIANPKAPQIDILDKTILNPGTYKTPSHGFALFHQSTFNNLLTDGLSVTLGARADYERQFVNYDSGMYFNARMSFKPSPPRPPIPPIEAKVGTDTVGQASQNFFQFLPKISLKYECTPDVMTYFTVSKGYKAGGYNIQMFSEIIQGLIMEKYMKEAPKVDISSSLSYRPEVTWNYEAGIRADFLDGNLRTEAAIFYMDIYDLQLTQFVNGGSGRILNNSGRGRSFGAEFSLNATINKSFFVDASYGYTNAKFTQYDGGKNRQGENVDYSGNYIPYTPQHTFSLGLAYRIKTYQKFIEYVTLSTNYNGCGKIYWNEKNDVEQPFYGLLNAKVSLQRKNVKLELWQKNILSADYGSFYFESMGSSFIQKGRPFTIGANLILSF